MKENTNLKLFKMLIADSTLNGAEIGAAVGVSRATVSAWINGKSTPRLKYIPDLARVLKVDTYLIEQIFYRTGV